MNDRHSLKIRVVEQKANYQPETMGIFLRINMVSAKNTEFLLMQNMSIK